MTKRILNTVPKYGDRGTGDTKKLQEALLERGYAALGSADDWFAGKTLKALQMFQKSCGLPGTGVIPADGGKTFVLLDLELKPIPEEALTDAPWLDEAHKYKGKKETESAFAAFMTTFWSKVGLPGFKGIATSARAWCALFIVVALSGGGVAYLSKGGAGAANQGRAYQAVDWKVNGIPRGAIVHVNSVKCGSGSNNHVTFANGSCAAKDIIEMVKGSDGVWTSTGKVKAGTTFPGFGGNQGNMVKESWYKVSTVCNVRWPDKDKDGKAIALPAPVLVSNGCNGKPATGDSTR